MSESKETSLEAVYRSDDWSFNANSLRGEVREKALWLGRDWASFSAQTGSFSKSVSRSVNDVLGGHTTVGTITSDGLYSAPPTVPTPSSVTVKAQSLQDATKVGTAPVTIAPESVQIPIAASSSSAQLGGTIQFMSTVSWLAAGGKR